MPCILMLALYGVQGSSSQCLSFSPCMTLVMGFSNTLPRREEITSVFDIVALL